MWVIVQDTTFDFWSVTCNSIKYRGLGNIYTKGGGGEGARNVGSNMLTEEYLSGVLCSILKT